MLKVKYSANCGCYYAAIPDLKVFVTETGVLLKPSEMAGKTSPQIKAYYEEELKSGKKYDFHIAVTEGKLKELEVEKPIPEKEEQVKEVTSTIEAPNEIIRSKIQTKDFVIGMVALMIAVCGMIASSFLTGKVLKTYFSDAMALFMAITIVVFNAIAFTTSQELWRSGKKMLASFLMLVSVVITLFSMSNTMQVFYESSEISITETHSENKKDTAMYSNLKTKVDTLQQSLKQKDADIEYYKEQKWGLMRLQKEREQINTELNAALDEQNKLLEETPDAGDESTDKHLTFIELVAKIFNSKNVGSVSLLIALLPSLFFDLISPLALSTAYFMLVPKKESEK